LTVIEERGGNGAQGVLHDNDADIADVKLDVGIVVEGSRRGADGGSGAAGQGVQLVGTVLVQVLRIREEQVPRMDIFLNRLERHRPL
jgi:hypothetical protein